MTTVNPATAAPATASQTAGVLNGLAEAAATAPSASDEASNTLTADFETFLTLLTTQMQYQDPLQPLESTEFVAQLAQFSTVEQTIATNKTLESILNALSGGGVGAFADWLGREVRTTDNVEYLVGDIDAYPPPAPSQAQSATLAVLGPTGFPVREIPFQPGAETVTWDGTLNNGALADPGLYRFEARYLTADGETLTEPAEAWGRVVEVSPNDGDGATLKLAGGGTTDTAAVTALRLAGG